MSVTIRKGPGSAQQRDLAPELSVPTLVASVSEASKRKQSGHTRPRPPLVDLAQDGRLRVANLLALLAVSHSTLYAGIKSGRYPAPDGRDGSFPFWNTATVKAFLAS
jgi:hypothetical protein